MTGTLDSSGLRPNAPQLIVVHSTRSYPEFGDLLAFHRERGFAGVGYHFFISASNRVYQARPMNIEGAHALGFNLRSVGICVHSKDGSIGKGVSETARALLTFVRGSIGDIEVISHTYAQVAYLNRLLDERGFGTHFDYGSDAVDPTVFDRARSELERFLDGNAGCDEDIRRIITGFKNCPGPMFNDIVRVRAP